MTDIRATQFSPTGILTQGIVLHTGENLIEGGKTATAPDGRTAIIRDPIDATFLPTYEDYAILVDGNNVTIQNIRIKCRSNQSAIRVLGSHCRIKNVFIEGAGSGIEMRITENAYSPKAQINNDITHVKMRNVKNGILLCCNQSIIDEKPSFTDLRIHDVGVTLAAGPDSGITIGPGCVLFNGNIVAQTWIWEPIYDGLPEPAGIRIYGTLTASFIKYTTENHNSPGKGYGIRVESGGLIDKGNNIYHHNMGKLREIISSNGVGDLNEISINGITIKP